MHITKLFVCLSAVMCVPVYRLRSVRRLTLVLLYMCLLTFQCSELTLIMKALSNKIFIKYYYEIHKRRLHTDGSVTDI